MYLCQLLAWGNGVFHTTLQISRSIFHPLLKAAVVGIRVSLVARMDYPSQAQDGLFYIYIRFSMAIFAMVSSSRPYGSLFPLWSGRILSRIGLPHPEPVTGFIHLLCLSQHVVNICIHED
jgi:hypothetical protein